MQEEEEEEADAVLVRVERAGAGRGRWMWGRRGSLVLTFMAVAEAAPPTPPATAVLDT